MLFYILFTCTRTRTSYEMLLVMHVHHAKATQSLCPLHGYMYMYMYLYVNRYYRTSSKNLAWKWQFCLSFAEFFEVNSQYSFCTRILFPYIAYTHVYVTTFAELLETIFKSFSKGCRIIRRAEFLEEVWYYDYYSIVPRSFYRLAVIWNLLLFPMHLCRKIFHGCFTRLLSLPASRNSLLLMSSFPTVVPLSTLTAGRC